MFRVRAANQHSWLDGGYGRVTNPLPVFLDRSESSGQHQIPLPSSGKGGGSRVCHVFSLRVRIDDAISGRVISSAKRALQNDRDGHHPEVYFG